MFTKVLLGMSGGTDSSVAAMLLKKQNYQITGMTFRAYDTASKACFEKETGCCSVDAIFEAKNLAEKLGFPHHILDVRDFFENTVIDNFVSEYLNARTPNPCVVCNQVIKWKKMIDEADKLDCQYIATGHYAQIINENNRLFIRKGRDSKKDQSYFLWTLTQENLKRTIFPLGELTKDRVREIALENKFTNIATKKESQEICFVPDDDYRNFLTEKIQNINEIIGEGDVRDTSGKFLGKHKGYPFYTIGQRKGLNIAVGYPVYVVNIDKEKNEVILGSKSELERNELFLSHVNLMKYPAISEPLKVKTKIRYNTPAAESILQEENGKLKITFNEPVSAVTPGQSAVFYEDDDLVGGGVIEV